MEGRSRLISSLSDVESKVPVLKPSQRMPITNHSIAELPTRYLAPARTVQRPSAAQQTSSGGAPGPAAGVSISQLGRPPLKVRACCSRHRWCIAFSLVCTGADSRQCDCCSFPVIFGPKSDQIARGSTACPSFTGRAIPRFTSLPCEPTARLGRRRRGCSISRGSKQSARFTAGASALSCPGHTS